MAFVVETGGGTPNANAYCDNTFVSDYLNDRNRSTENSWNSVGVTRQRQAIVAATDYIDSRWGPRFKGIKYRTTTPGRNASGLIQFSAVPLDTETLTIGTITYRFVAALAQENDILIGATVSETVDNIAATLDGDGLDATGHEDTQLNYDAGALNQSDDLAVYARVKGSSGDFVAFATNVTGATINGSGYLTGGIDEAPQPLEFPRAGLYGRDGVSVAGIPLRLKQATAEYAVRSLASTLAPDPTVDASLALVRSSTVKLGSIEESVEYANSGEPVVSKPYPAADALLVDYVTSGGGVVR